MLFISGLGWRDAVAQVKRKEIKQGINLGASVAIGMVIYAPLSAGDM